MKKYLKNYIHTIRKFWFKNFWTRPDNLWALKVTAAIACMVIPCHILGLTYIGACLALGVVGGALAETDDHPKGRKKTFILTLVCFLLVSTTVELLKPHPWIYCPTLSIMIFALILIGGLSRRYLSVTFGSILIAFYAMMGANVMPWYWQPLLLTSGAGIYGGISLYLLRLRPCRLLDEQLAIAYDKLAQYVSIKAGFFPSTAEEQRSKRIKLAKKNIEVCKAIDNTKQVIYLFANTLGKDQLHILTPYHKRWLVLQQLHERAASSHQRYDILSARKTNGMVIEGFNKMLDEIAGALRFYAQSLLMETPYQSPVSLRWTTKALEQIIQEYQSDRDYPALQLLFKNLKQMQQVLMDIDTRPEAMPIETLVQSEPPLMERIKCMLDKRNPRFRYGIRLVICFVIGYLITKIVHIRNADWIVLTTIFVCQQSYTATVQRIPQRTMGTIIGVIIGMCLSILAPTYAAQIIILVTAIYLFFTQLRKNYSYAVTYITIFVIASYNLHEFSGIDMMIPRMVCTLIGVSLAFLVNRLIKPEWLYTLLPQQINECMQKNKRYMQSIYLNECRGQQYYHNRRTAHMADSTLTSTWQGMFAEPNSKRFLQKRAYHAAYHNHSLLSYISALGAHHYDFPVEEKNIPLCESVTDMMQDVINLLENDTPENREQLEQRLLPMEKQIRNLTECALKDPEQTLLHNIRYETVCIAKEVLKIGQTTSKSNAPST